MVDPGIVQRGGGVPPLKLVFNEGSTLKMRYFYRVMTTFSNERVGSDPGKWGGPPPLFRSANAGMLKAVRYR